MSDPDGAMDRRTFLGKSAALTVGGAALASTALSYSRIAGANDRISLCHIGNGSRGEDLDWIVSKVAATHNVEMSAVCDLWKLNREKAVATNAKYSGRAPRAFQYFEEVLALKDIDAVIISTPEHSHSPILKTGREPPDARQTIDTAMLRRASRARSRCNCQTATDEHHRPPCLTGGAW